MRIHKELIERHAHGFLMEKLKERGCTIRHIGFFVYLMDKNRSLRWCETFGLPRKDTMKTLRIKNRRTYYGLFEDMKLPCLIRVVDESNPHHAVRISIMTDDFNDFIMLKNEKK